MNEYKEEKNSRTFFVDSTNVYTTLKNEKGMKRNLTYLLFVVLISAASCSFTTKSFDNPDKDKVLLEIIKYVVERGHFDPKSTDDEYSKGVFNSFIEAIDGQKRYFLQSDIDDFKKYELEIDDQLKNNSLEFFNVSHERLLKRMEESKAIVEEVLVDPFDFSTQETINVDYENLPYATNKANLKERWRKLLMFSTLSSYHSKMKENSNSENPRSSAEIEKEAREATRKTIMESFGLMNDLQRRDWFSMYVNSLVEEFDPHTNYFAPEDKDRFDVSMSGKFEGIGARLQKRTDGIRIVEVISGGPVWKEKSLEVGDEIMKVAQEGEQPVDIAGMRLDDAVKLIKGPKGTKVEESYAKTALVSHKNHTFGVINLPKFYIDFKDYKERNAASDVALEIERLKAEGMDGLVLDLRDNGGGSLKTVVDMAGFFIKEGPVVQVKSAGQRKDVLSDTDKSILWDGPLVILVNELSASASEILAAAMQDYKRAIVIGSKQTYGKGTVQNVIDLNQFLQNSDLGDVGALKITTQKFYRINGGSTQLEGVKGDVVVPDRYSYINIGEKDQKNPLSWDRIEPASYEKWDGIMNYEETVKNSQERMANNDYLKLVDENARWVKKQQDNMVYPLNYEAFKRELEKDESMAKRFKKLSEYKTNLTFLSLPYEQKEVEKDEELKLRRDRWHEALSGDVYVEEAINVLTDLKEATVKQRVAAIKG